MRNLRLVMLALITVSSCRSLPAARSISESPATGAETPRSAVSMYMQGMRNVDFKLIGEVWGTREELARDRYQRDEFEKRAFVASCYLGWPGYQVTSEKPGVDGARRVVVRSTGRTNEQQAALRLEENSSGRWFVAAADLSGVSPDHCS